MRRLRGGDIILTPEDRAACAKWRRGILVVYGCAGLIVLAAWGVYRLIKDGPGQTIAGTASAVMSPQPGAARPPQP
jgi:hypothetical protein